MLCPPQYANGSLSRALAPASIAEKSSQANETGFAAFVRRSAAASSSSKTSTPTARASLSAGSAKRGEIGHRGTDIDSAINIIGRSIRSIFATPIGAVHLDPAGESYAALYEMASDLVSVHGKGGELYDRIKLELERAVGSFSRDLRGGRSDNADVQQDWLLKLQLAWNAWQERTTLTCHILTLLDQAYTSKSSRILSLAELSLDLFRHSIAAEVELQQHAFDCISSVCNNIRAGNSTPYKVLHSSLMSMYSKLDLYDELEQTLLVTSELFFKAHASHSVLALDTSTYINQAQQQIERERVDSEWLYARQSGKKKSVAIAYDQLYKEHVETLLTALPNLLGEQDLGVLTTLYAALSIVKQLPHLRTAFTDYVRTQGEAIMMDQANDDKMIDRLLDFKEKIDRIVRVAFTKDVEFQQAQRDTFEVFVNKRENKAAELIAKFLDDKLRSGNKTMSDQQMENVLNEALALFRFTHAKDMFEEFYKRLFAKRLLLNRSASSDAEQSMLLKLKEECGPGFTQKLETMLTDIALSDDMMKAFTASREKAKTESGGSGGGGGGVEEAFELSVNVLTQAHWPTYPQVEIIVPPDMAAATDSFAKFYEMRNQGRKLQWAHTLGTTSLTAQFAKAGEKELLVSTFQTIVLLLFNTLPSGARLTYEQIKTQTGLVDKELKRTLQSLACGQIPTRVLRKDPQGKDVDETDAFSVNEQLKNERKRIRINMIQLAETKEEQKSTVDRVMFDREMVLQATTVRIMKAKKTIKHAELLQEVVQSIAA